MKAIVYEKYGTPEVLELREIEKPVPTDDQVLVRVRASSLNIREWYVMTGLIVVRSQAGWLKPKDPRLGVDYAGLVEAVGGNVKDFRPGDEVFGGRNGAFAEYVTALADRAIVHKPANVTFEQAAAVPVGAITALQGLRDKARLQPGEQVLINGASGSVGTFAIQVAKHLGGLVTAVCSSRNVEQARALGADHVVDYTREDFARSGRRYEVVFDIAGSRPWSAYKPILTPTARFIIVGGPHTNHLIGPLGHVLKTKVAALGASQKAISFIAQFNKADMVVLQEMLAAGQLTPAIDRQYPLSELPEAMRYLATGHARGKIVITLS